VSWNLSRGRSARSLWEHERLYGPSIAELAEGPDRTFMVGERREEPVGYPRIIRPSHPIDGRLPNTAIEEDLDQALDVFFLDKRRDEGLDTDNRKGMESSSLPLSPAVEEELRGWRDTEPTSEFLRRLVVATERPLHQGLQRRTHPPELDPPLRADQGVLSSGGRDWACSSVTAGRCPLDHRFFLPSRPGSR